jgi:hypothetical protein
MEWIKCSDRFPLEEGKYLIVCRQRRVIGDYNKNGWYTLEFIDSPIGDEPIFGNFSDLQNWVNVNVTHWMPIPPNPYEGKE